jgi:hypothetical protein
MAAAPRPGRWSLDLQEQASVVEQLAGGALVAAAVGLAALGIARAAGAHPSGALLVAALALAGAGVAVLGASFGVTMRRSARRTLWAARADAGTPGVLLFVLEAERARPDAGGAVAALRPVRCRVGAGAAAGDLVGTHGVAAGGPWEAADDRISRIGGLLMTRFHPAFFPGAPEPWSGTYEFSWEAQHEGGWRTLLEGSAEVEFAPLAGEVAPTGATSQTG